MFDVLTYQKGGSLLRMLEQYLGEEEFRQGISLYLKTMPTRTPRPATCGTRSRRPTHRAGARLMDSWIWQAVTR